MPQNILNELTVAVIGAAWREGRDLVAGEHRNNGAPLQAHFPFVAGGDVIVHAAAEHLADGLAVERSFDKGRDHGVDHRRLQLGHDAGQKRFASALSTALQIGNVQHPAATEWCFHRDALPIFF